MGHRLNEKAYEFKIRCTKTSVHLKQCPGNYKECTEKAVSKAICTFIALPVTDSHRASRQPSILSLSMAGRSTDWGWLHCLLPAASTQAKERVTGSLPPLVFSLKQCTEAENREEMTVSRGTGERDEFVHVPTAVWHDDTSLLVRSNASVTQCRAVPWCHTDPRQLSLQFNFIGRYSLYTSSWSTPDKIKKEEFPYVMGLFLIPVI